MGITNPRESDTSKPVLINKISIPIKEISCGFRHTFLLTNDGNVLSWGYGRHGVLALSSSSSSSDHLILSPQKIIFPSVDLNLINENENFIDNNKNNKNNNNNNNLNINNKNEYNKKNNNEEVKIKKIITGGMHAMAISENGFIYSWGEGRELKTGFKNNNDVFTPTLISSLANTLPLQISLGSNGSLFLSRSSFLF